MPSLLFIPKQLSGRSSGGAADGTKTDRMCHGGATGLSWDR
ncbi:LSU ribosomal protein L14p (L23e) [Paraburkholderia tropica]|nr:LSU ribosomal protein L14p (L23e) [Paraburkholderia tropica]